MTMDYKKFWEAESFIEQLREKKRRRKEISLEGETIKLFNPFHSRADGRFTSGGGGAGQTVAQGGGSAGGGGGKSTEEVKTETISKASKAGKIVKTTGKVLGLTGLGVVGFAVLAGVASAMGGDSEASIEVENPKDNPENQKKLEEVNQKIEDLTRNWPKSNSPEEAARIAEAQLRELGITDIPDNLKIEIGSPPPGAGGAYDASTNTLVISPFLGETLQEGDPTSVHAMIHEIAHSAQEADHVSGNIWGDNPDFTQPGSQDEFGDYLEGQNDLVTSLAMSKLYEEPLSNSKVVDLSNEYGGLLRDKTYFETGVSVSGLEHVEIGYEDQAETWAGIVTVLAKTQGGTPTSQLITAHDSGFNATSHHNILMSLFPDQMRQSGYYTETEEGGFLGIGTTTVVSRRLPPIREIDQWLRDQYQIQSDEAFNQMMEEAVGQ